MNLPASFVAGDVEKCDSIYYDNFVRDEGL